MELAQDFIITVDGVPYHVRVSCPLSNRYHHPGPIVQPAAPAPWVTAQRVDHLPSR